jgi:TetR/AcrR family transcriptional regulator, regulator of cefoperazone and chloramphenicol sensitivity
VGAKHLYSAQIVRAVPFIDEDLTARARILDAAIELFAAGGVGGTTIRAVAEEAGVSPGLVIHHFGSKEGLRRAADDAVFERVVIPSGEQRTADSVTELLARRAEQASAAMRSYPALCDYLARALLEGTPAGRELFGRLVAAARTDLGRLEKTGAVRAGTDELWRAVQHILLVVGPLMLRPLVEAELGQPLFSEREFRRWIDANVDLLANGVYEPSRRSQPNAASARKR